jgi:hypothetical protein
MNCLECQEWLQRRLDGDEDTVPAAVEQHRVECARCREQHNAALRLLEGLKQLPPYPPRPGLAQSVTAKVLHERRQRQARVRRRVFVTMALAASIMLLVLGPYYLMPNLPHDVPKAPDPVVKKDDKRPEPPRQDRPVEPRDALASLSERIADTTRDHARVVLAAADLDRVGVEELPRLEVGRGVGQEVTEGVRAVTSQARRAFDFFARELPMPEMETPRN